MTDIRLEKNDKFLNAIIHSKVIGVFIYQEDSKIVFANKRFCEILSYESGSDLIGKNILEFLTEEEKKEIEIVIKRRTANKRFVIELKDHYYKNKNSALVPVSVFGYTIEYNEKPSGVVLVFDKTKEVSIQKIFFTLIQINQLITRTDNTDNLLRQTIDILVDKVGYIACTVGYIDRDNLFRGLYIKANTQEHQQAIKSLIIGVDPNTPYGKGTVSKAYHTKVVSLISNIDKEPSTSYWHEYYKKFNIESVCSIPILKHGKVEYIIIVFDSAINSFSLDYMHLLKQISVDLSFALEKIERALFFNLIATAINSGDDFVVITDDKFNIMYVNDKELEFTGYKRHELLGKHHSIFSSHTHTKEFAREFYSTLTSGKVYSGIMKYKIKDGSLKDVLVNIFPYIKEGKTTNYISVSKKIEESQNKLLEDLHRALNYDYLTNLINLNGFRGSIDKFIQRALYKKQIGALFIINPVEFGKINEAYDFETGNKILLLIASRLKNFFRDYDVAAKLESDRFGTLVKDLRSEEDALVIANNLLFELSKPYLIGKDKMHVPFNIGISFFPKDAENTQKLFDGAYIALHDAKQKGENQIGFYNKDIKEEIIKRLYIQSDLMLALTNKNFIPFYQPYVDKNKTIVGAEALMRIVKDDRVVPPIEFIEVLEKSLYITDAESLIINQVLDNIEHFKPKVPISINLSLKSLLKRSLMQYLASEINFRDLIKPNANILNIEILERSIIENFDHIKKLIEEFRNLNIFFSLDDFGTGYSSLSYLSKIKVGFLKIDISFIRTLFTPDTKKIVKAIITISKDLNIKTIAEGVETIEQFEELSSMGCDYFQGFLFYKPMPAKEFFGLLD